jgi:hypothetical protein
LGGTNFGFFTAAMHGDGQRHRQVLCT